MITAIEDSDMVPNLVGGQWQTAPTAAYESVFNPSTGERIARTPLSDAAEVDRVVRSAADSARHWAETPVIERARVMFRFRSLLEKDFEELARLVTREHGKTIAESRAEVNRGIEVVEFACGIPSLMMGEILPNIARDVDATCVRHPVGVCVGITPYNFPAMVPMWMFPIAIVCGNPFILKPSEKTPLSAIRLGQLLIEAGLPAGVFSIVHGGRECVDAVLTHPLVSAISFVGSTRVAQHVYQTGTATGKRVQAAGGAKNHLIIMPDADIDQTVKALAASAYGCAGQRCMAGSLAVAVGEAGDPLVDGLVRHAERMKIGPTDGDDSIEMGPVIRQEHRSRVAEYLDIAVADGATVALDGRGRSGSPGFLIGPSVVDHVNPEMRVAREEIFGPVLSVARVKTIEEGIAMGDACEYGNGAVIFTQSGYAARQFQQHFNAGMLGINVGVPAPMAWFPFTGWNRSFFGDLHVQGKEGIQFYTRQKVTLARWPQPTDSHVDPVWRSK
jgi:malonate-semialdehyde dehydrogenase (acetylating)/methylmalonate-semialdehyde dehydrogenase